MRTNVYGILSDRRTGGRLIVGVSLCVVFLCLIERLPLFMVMPASCYISCSCLYHLRAHYKDLPAKLKSFCPGVTSFDLVA